MFADHAPPEWKDRQTLWNAVEDFEKKSDAQLARSLEFSFPFELSTEENITLCKEVAEYYRKQGMCVDFCINAPDGGNKNIHCHMSWIGCLITFMSISRESPTMYRPTRWSMDLRRGEVVSLIWDGIHGDQYISISKEQRTEKGGEKCFVVGHTKTCINRRFPQTTEILERYGEDQDNFFPGSNYLFPSEDMETGIINNNVVYKFYSRMCEKLGDRHY